MTTNYFPEQRKVDDVEPAEPVVEPFTPQMGPCSPFPNDTMLQGVARHAGVTS